MQFVRQSLALLVCCVLILPLTAQQPRGGQQQLRIIVLEGNNSVNYIPIRTATAPVVEVRDLNERPVEGAAVTFKAPASGPGAVFEGDKPIYSTITDARGQAGARGYTINATPGAFVIEVSASYEGKTGTAVIRQANSMDQLPPGVDGYKKGGKLKWVLLSLGLAAGGGVGAYLALRPGRGPISVSIGSVLVGGPR